jgi:hypothetical protein
VGSDMFIRDRVEPASEFAADLAQVRDYLEAEALMESDRSDLSSRDPSAQCTIRPWDQAHSVECRVPYLDQALVERIGQVSPRALVARRILAEVFRDSPAARRTLLTRRPSGAPAATRLPRYELRQILETHLRESPLARSRLRPIVSQCGGPILARGQRRQSLCLVGAASTEWNSKISSRKPPTRPTETHQNSSLTYAGSCATLVWPS